MLSVSEVLNGIFTVAKLVYDQVQLAKANKAQCVCLGKSIAIIEKAVRGLNTVQNQEQYQVGLNALYETLQEALKLIKKFSQNGSWFRLLAVAGIYSEKFQALDKKLFNSVLSLNLGLSSQQIIDHDRELKAQLEDQQFIKINLDTIIKLNQEANTLNQKRDLEAKEARAIEAQQLASIQAQFAILTKNQFVPLKPLIDPAYQISFFELIFNKQIGEGSFGKVYLGHWNEEIVAIKRLEGLLTESDKAEFIREVKIMSGLRNKNITQFYGACLEAERACLVMEYMEQGSLYDFLEKNKLTPEQQKAIALNIARGLFYLHKQNILHRDFKSANILLNINGEAKISDFGLAKTKATSVKTVEKRSLERSQAIRWLAPECLERGSEYTKESDIYSYGVILWELMTYQRPYAGLTSEQVIDHIRAGKREIIPPQTPDIFMQLIKQCWHADPTKRPLLGEVIHQLEAYQPRSVIVSNEADKNYEQGVTYQTKKDYAKAFGCYQLAANENYARAKTNLGLLFLSGFLNDKGQYVENKQKADKKQAHFYFYSAAKQGHARAMFNVAMMLEHGDGVEQDIEQALFWYGQPELKDDQKAIDKIKKLMQTDQSLSSQPKYEDYTASRRDSQPNTPIINRAAREIEAVRKDKHTIVGGKTGGQYLLIPKINIKEANELLVQEGIEIKFEEGKNRKKIIFGQGQFGKVRLAQKKDTKQYVVVKKIKGEQAIAACEKEDYLQAELSHLSNIMPLLGSVKMPDKIGRPTLYQFMQLAGFGSGVKLQTQCAYLSKDQLSLKERLFVYVAHGILTGLSQMNELNIYHLDFKPANLVFNMRGEVYIIDIGCAQKIEDHSKHIQGGNGDTRYFSPERLDLFRLQEKTDSIVNGKEGDKIDAWTAGLALLEMWINNYPLDMCGFAEKLKKWDNHYFEAKLQTIPWLQQAKPGSFSSLVAALLIVDPNERLNCEQALKHPVFDNLKTNPVISQDREKIFKMLHQLEPSSAISSTTTSNEYNLFVRNSGEGDENYAHTYYQSPVNKSPMKFNDSTQGTTPKGKGDGSEPGEVLSSVDNFYNNQEGFVHKNNINVA